MKTVEKLVEWKESYLVVGMVGKMVDLRAEVLAELMVEQ